MELPHIRLAIVGSRNFTDRQRFDELLAHYFSHTFRSGVIVDVIISGEANGVDTLAKDYARHHQLNYLPCPPDTTRYPVMRDALLRRNDDIVAAATHVLALPSRSGSGTQYTINRAIKCGITPTVYYID